jgi:hypothetical protein
MTTQRYEIEAWLGDTSDWTDEQIDLLVVESDAIAERYPDEDDREEREAALSAAAQCLTGDLLLETAGEDLRRARADASRAMAAARQMARMAVLHGGTPQAVAAREAGIDRMTVRKDLGKR